MEIGGSGTTASGNAPEGGASIDEFPPVTLGLTGDSSNAHEDGVVEEAESRRPRRLRRCVAAVGRRRIPIAFVLLGLLCMAGGAGSFLNYQASVRWHERAETRQQERDAARSESAELASHLADAKADIERLNRQIRTTRNRLASSEQQHRQAQATAEFFVALSADLTDAGAQLDECLVRLASWIGDQPSLFDSEYAWSSWSSEGDRTYRQCSHAREQFSDIALSLD